MDFNLPNLFTFSRLLMVPVLVGVFYLPWAFAGQAAAGVFILAGVTDALDGWAARRQGLTSRFGAFVDPVVDKLMVATALVLVVETHGSWLMTVPAAVIIGREIAVSGLREWMAEIGRRAHLNVSRLAKIKTGFQMTAISLLLWETPILGLPVYELGLILLIAAAVLTLWSALLYLGAAWPHMRDAQGGPGSS